MRGLGERAVVHDERLIGDGRQVEAQVGGVAGRQLREPSVPGPLKVDRVALAVGARESSLALTPGRRSEGQVMDINFKGKSQSSIIGM